MMVKIMNDSEFSKVGLYEHNVKSYRKIKEAYESGEKIVGIVHATGVGKSYNALELACDNPDKKIVYVVPNNSIAEHIENIIRDNPNLDRERDFPNLEFKTYHSFINYSYEELEELDCDLLILDEFHHLGAPVWGSRIKAIIETHPEMLVFGMTAYTIRDRGTPYERDMANSNGGELFSNKIVSRYDLVDAMLDGVLPRDIIYRTSYTNLLGIEKELENKINKLKATKEELEEYKKVLETIKKRVAEAPGVTEVVRKYVKPNGKYFYFCPPRSEEGTNDINTIMKEAYEWFKTYVPEEDIIFYSTTSEMKDEGKHNREMFYNDKTLDGKDASKKLRVMFAINQYNEGVHAPNVDGVIMGRGTTSDIVYFEQLGRVLSVGGDTKEMYIEYDKYTYEELLEIAKNKEIAIKDNISREELIEKIIAPVIIDLTNNIEFIKELEDNIQNRVRERREKSTTTKNISKLMDVSFDIDIVNEDLYQVLSSLKNRVNNDWESMYELAKSYYEHYGNLDINFKFRTFNGIDYDENGFNLGMWLATQRTNYKNEKLSEERKEKLLLLNMKMNFINEKWELMYELAKKYYEHYGNSDIPNLFKTKNGIDYDENGFNLGIWIDTQRANYKNEMLNEEKIGKLLEIKMKFHRHNEKWDEWYNLARIYYEHYGNLYMPNSFKTKNGIDYDEDGVKLGLWIFNQSTKLKQGKLDEGRKEKLLLIDIESITNDSKWEKWYNLAKKYYEHYGSLDISDSFKTTNGIDYDENGVKLGVWLRSQKSFYRKGKIREDRRLKLEEIGFIEIVDTNRNDTKWESMYELAKKYYEHYGNLEIPDRFSTINGYEYQDNGIKLGIWLRKQRQKYKSGKLEPDRMEKLELIGINYDIHDKEWNDMYQLAKSFYERNGHLNIPVKLKTKNGIDYDENGVNLGMWYSKQKQLIKQGKLSEDRIKKLKEIGMFKTQSKVSEEVKEQIKTLNWDSMYKMAKEFYDLYGHLDVKILYGIDLGSWIEKQQEFYRRKRLSKDEIIKLREIGIIEADIKEQIQAMYESFCNEGQGWSFMYDLAKIYYEHNNHINIPEDFRTIDGYNSDERGFVLGKWILLQKENYKNGTLSDEEFIKLKELKFENTPNDFLWENMYELAKKYYEHHGNLEMDYGFTTINGYEFNENGINLGYWLNNQKKKFFSNTLDPYRRKLLQEIGLKNYDNYFEYMYELAKKFYEEHGHLNIRYKFMHNPNAVNLTFDEVELLRWKENCKKAKREGKLDDETFKRLESIGVFLTSHEENWNNMYTIATLYSNHHLSLNVPDGYKTFDGVEYDENGFELSKWLNNQIAKLKQGELSEDRIKKLNEIGITWTIRNNTEEIKNICFQYGIDYELNKKTIKRIPSMILISKINYLQLNFQSPVVNGILHEIFTMSNEDLKMKYGISVEELVNKYYNLDYKRRNL